MKSKNNPKMNEFKIRTCITLSPDTHSKAREIGLNLSYFAERALNWLYFHLESGDLKLLTGNNLILSPELKNNLENEWIRGESNPRTSPCEGDVNLSPDLENKSNSDDLKFSTPPRFEGENDSQLVSIGEFFTSGNIADEFRAFCEKTGVTTEKGKKAYVSALSKLTDIYAPADVSNYKTTHGKALSEKAVKGLGKLLKFLETKRYMSSLNGIPLEIWRANIRISEKGDSKMEARLKDLTNEEIRAARDRLKNQDLKDMFTLLAHSGARFGHLHKALKANRKIHHIGNVIYLDVKDLSAGTKLEERFYFPKEDEEILKRLKVTHGYDYYQKIIGASGTDARPVNVASLRKWSYNQLVTGTPKLEETAADVIQGRRPKSVGSKHYADLNKIAAEGYETISEKLLRALPL